MALLEFLKIKKTATPNAANNWNEKLKLSLAKTRDQVAKKLLTVFGGAKIDEDLYQELEAILLNSDVGYSATQELLSLLRAKVNLKALKDGQQLKAALREALCELLMPLTTINYSENKAKPLVIMMVGVNGAGKTTTIGKLAHYFQTQNKSVILAAGDTFRAAAAEQLIEWADRNQIAVVGKNGGDSAAICYDAIVSAKAKGIDVVLADTAGRLSTQLNLMAEIKKIKRVITKAIPESTPEIFLVLDATLGQNGLNQLRAFDDALNLTGLILTKLDGSAKGGVVCAIAKERAIPLHFIGMGEAIDDLRSFVVEDYVDAILN